MWEEQISYEEIAKIFQCCNASERNKKWVLSHEPFSRKKGYMVALWKTITIVMLVAYENDISFYNSPFFWELC